MVAASDSAGNQAQRSIGFALHFDEAVTITGYDGRRYHASLRVTANLTTGYFTLELSEPSAQPVSVAYITESGSALAGEDFIFATGVVELAAGVVSAQIAIDIIGDDIVENDETFRLRLYDPQGVTLATR